MELNQNQNKKKLYKMSKLIRRRDIYSLGTQNEKKNSNIKSNNNRKQTFVVSWRVLVVALVLFDL